MSRVGADIKSVCRKCGETWHVVIALADAQIAKVECGECGARHRYRPVEGLVSKRVSTRSAPRKVRAKAAPIVAPDLSRPRRSFQTSDTYEVGDRVVHSSFGEGVVQTVRGATKVEILFDVGPKTLVHGRRGSG